MTGRALGGPGISSKSGRAVQLAGAHVAVGLPVGRRVGLDHGGAGLRRVPAGGLEQLVAHTLAAGPRRDRRSTPPTTPAPPAAAGSPGTRGQRRSSPAARSSTSPRGHHRRRPARRPARPRGPALPAPRPGLPSRRRGTASSAAASAGRSTTGRSRMLRRNAPGHRPSPGLPAGTGHGSRRCTVRRGPDWYASSPYGRPSMFQLHEISGVIRRYGPEPNRPARSVSSAVP